jgi:hypothetical protein
VRRSNDISSVAVGETVTRYLGGTVPMELRVTEVTKDKIVCAAWTFDRKTGAEIDEELGWGVHGTGSYIVPGGGKDAQSDQAS